MEYSMIVDLPNDLDGVLEAIRALLNKCPAGRYKVSGTIEPKPIAAQGTFDLTKAMEDVLRSNPNHWFTAKAIEDAILNHPHYGPLARSYGYKPGGLRKGVAASGLRLYREGKVERRGESGSYEYRWKQ